MTSTAEPNSSGVASDLGDLTATCYAALKFYVYEVHFRTMTSRATDPRRLPNIEFTAARIVEQFDPSHPQSKVGHHVAPFFGLGTDSAELLLQALASRGTLVRKASHPRSERPDYAWAEALNTPSAVCAWSEVDAVVGPRWDLALDAHRVSSVGEDAEITEQRLWQILGTSRVPAPPAPVPPPEGPQARHRFLEARRSELVGTRVLAERARHYRLTPVGADVAQWCQLFLRDVDFRHGRSRCAVCQAFAVSTEPSE